MKSEGFAIITGSSRGLGKAMAIRLAEEGYKVVVNYVSSHSTEAALDVVKEINNSGGQAIAVQADVAEYQQCEKIVQAGVAAFGEKVAVLVNNAGIEYGKNFLEITVAQYTRQIQVALLGQLHLIHVVLSYMVKAKFGCIINISSVNGIVGCANEIDYSAAKGGVIGMTKAMAKEFAQYNIRVNSIAPGMIMTDMIKNAPQEDVAYMKSITPLRTIGDVSDIADCMSYILKAKFLTGQIISPNGGLVI